ncbi:MAG: site-2 protease family protein [Clostridia bacterium]|nr:site-2 protease family protein [Clostridia bacterium]
MINLLGITDVLRSIGGILLAIIILLAMVTIHEFGHYIAGKALGFKINEFSVGFGPALWKRRSKTTGELFAVRLVPLGGYCAFDGEDDYGDGKTEQEKTEENPFKELETDGAGTSSSLQESKKTDEELEEYPEPKGERFNDQAPWKRIIVLIAGATMNYLLALFIVICTFAFIGQPLYKVIEPKENGYLDSAYQAGDIIESVEGNTVYLITDYMDALSGKKSGEEISVGVIRNGERQTIQVTLKADCDFVNMSDTGKLLKAMGLYSLHMNTVKLGFFETLGRSVAYSWKIGGTVLRSFGELLTGKLGLEAVGGPITTITVTAEAASSSLLSFLNVASLIGVNLAVFNLLPIPALDGSKVVFCAIEWIRKKPINQKVETIIHLVGIVFLFGFAILVDLLKLF